MYRINSYHIHMHNMYRIPFTCQGGGESRGKVEALRSSHSDLLVLRKLLFEAAFESLKSGTEERYYAFRKERLAVAARGWRLLPRRWASSISPWAKPE
jgi:hypothetical protein